MLATSRVIGGRDDGLTGGVEAKVGLVHQLVIEGRVDRCVVVCDGLVAVVRSTALVDLRTVLEELVEDALLLIIVDVHPFALDGAAMRLKRREALSQLIKKKANLS